MCVCVCVCVCVCECACMCVCVCVSLETHDVNVSDVWVDNTRCFSESVGEFLSSHGQLNEPTNSH